MADPDQAQRWVADLCEREGLDWEKLTKGEQFRITVMVPCPIRCFQVGGPVDVEPGERCPECGKIYVAPPTALERIVADEGRPL